MANASAQAAALKAENEHLRTRLAEVEQVLRAIREGEVDALIGKHGGSDRVFSLRGAETVYRVFLETVREALALLAQDGRLLYCNRQLEMLTGRASTLLIGTPFPELVCDDDQVGLTTLLRGGGVAELHLRDGTRIPVHAVASRLPQEDGAQICLALTDLREVDALHRAEHDLRAANGELEAFAYSVSHDLRVPLRAIDGYSRMLEQKYGGALDAEARRLVGVVRSSSQRMGQLIDDILNFSRMGRNEMAPQEVNMEALAAATGQELAAQRAGREIELKIAPLPAASGDPVMLRRVWTNLIDNATKFTRPKRSALIEIGGRTEGAEAVYWVKDNGVGFDMQYAQKLFCLFQRLHGADEFEGTGAGLAIVKRIVERHGGRVWAEARLGEGATFYFALQRPPRKKVQ